MEHTIVIASLTTRLSEIKGQIAILEDIITSKLGRLNA
jgi:hypothetical protein